MYWINGQRHDALAPSDRGLQFGDGCFTTARVIDGKIELLPWHLERLKQAAQRLMLPATDWAAFEREMALAAESIPLGVVKAILRAAAVGGVTARPGARTDAHCCPQQLPCALFAVARAGHYACAQPGGAGAQSAAGGVEAFEPPGAGADPRAS